VKALSATPQNTLPGADDITWLRLPNDITLLARDNFNSQSVVINGYIATGSLYDLDEKLGLAYFTAAALMRGTAKRSFQEIYNALESAGASMGFSAGAHTTSFSGRSLAEDLPLLLALLRESLQTPVFPPEQIERLRTQILTNLAIRAQDTAEVASLTSDEIIYANHPYRRPEDGYPETIQAITREDMVEFHRRTYGPARMVIVVVGGVDPSDAVEMVTHALGDWQNPQQPPPPVLPPTTALTGIVRKHVPIAGKSQSDLVVSSLGPTRKSEDFIATSLGNNILGQFGMMGRIGEVVRERSGLAYYAYTSLNAGLGPGSWEVAAGVNPANLERAIELVREELRRFVSEPVTADELADSQANYIGRLPLSLESNNGMASALLNLERFDLGLDYYRRYPELIRCVTPENVLEAARRYLDPDRLAIASAG
jgi:zinc protease